MGKFFLGVLLAPFVIFAVLSLIVFIFPITASLLGSFIEFFLFMGIAFIVIIMFVMAASN